MISPSEWAASNPARTGGRPCWFCSLSQRDLLEKAHTEDKLTLTQVLGYMLDVLGIEDATIGKVRAHFLNGKHHRRRA